MQKPAFLYLLIYLKVRDEDMIVQDASGVLQYSGIKKCGLTRQCKRGLSLDMQIVDRYVILTRTYG